MRTHQLTLVNAVQPTPTINVLRPRNAILVFSASPQMTFNSSSGVVLQVRWSSTSSRICFRPSNPSVGSLRKPERRSHDGVHNCSNVGVVSCSGAVAACALQASCIFVQRHGPRVRVKLRLSAITMALPPIFYHCFKAPLPYATALSLQERIHAHQLLSRKASQHNHRDYLLLLEHRPVYTFGRRQVESLEEISSEALRLRGLGADCVSTRRGGQTTYHGPGQIIGYPLLDLGRSSPPMGIREYICRLQKTVEAHLTEGHGIQHIPSEHTGVFLDHHTKIASIGVQVRHRLTNHGFALNVTEEPFPWFNRVVACGLTDVKPGCIAEATKPDASITVTGELPGLIARFGRIFERDMVELDVGANGEVEEAIRAIEREARERGSWPHAPVS